MNRSRLFPSIISTGKTVVHAIDSPLKRVISVSKTVIPGLNLHVVWEFDKTTIKSGSLKCLQVLVDSGIPQKWAAYICGVSPSYASKLLNNK